MLFLLLPLAVFAQSGRTQSVALVPFWGENERTIKEFGQELFKAVGDMQGFRPVAIDMTNLPDDVPEGGFPPYICPSPSLIKTNPLALTGELTPDAEDSGFWHLRLYLWEMTDTRLVFSDELTAYDREECAAGLPGMLEWLFSWLKRGGGSGEGEAGEGGDQFGQGKQVFITTSMPLHWMYVGGRFGWSPRIQTNGDPDFNGFFPDSFLGAVSFSIAFFPESVPFFSRFAFQAEGIFDFRIPGYEYKNDIVPIAELSIVPAALLKFQAYRHGNMLLSLFGGAYARFELDDKIGIGKQRLKYEGPGGDLQLGITGGGSFGSKWGPGIFFIDLRYSGDFYRSCVIEARYKGYERSDVTISIGYEFGLVTKK